MARTVIFLIAGLVGAVAIALFWPHETQEFAYSSDTADLPLMARVAELERTVQFEARQRAALEDEISALRDELMAVNLAPAGDAGPGPAARRFGGGDDNDEEPSEQDRARLQAALQEREAERNWRRMSTQERLVAGGFSASQAQWIDRRTEEIAVEAMQARYEAERNGEQYQSVDTDTVLRQELGEADYERYRESTRQSMSVNVGDVLASSAAEQAGLQRGDEIMSYAGQRVYETSDLNRFAMQGRPGESVLVEVMRDGQPMQVVLSRGPLGISAFSRGRGRR